MVGWSEIPSNKHGPFGGLRDVEPFFVVVFRFFHFTCNSMLRHPILLVLAKFKGWGMTFALDQILNSKSKSGRLHLWSCHNQIQIRGNCLKFVWHKANNIFECCLHSSFGILISFVMFWKSGLFVWIVLVVLLRFDLYMSPHINHQDTKHRTKWSTLKNKRISLL